LVISTVNHGEQRTLVKGDLHRNGAGPAGRQ
jgi:hypothetical protein